MQSLKQLCTPRQSVFDTQRRDTVLDLIDLISDRIDPNKFFEENFVTEGMKTLLEQAFRRLEGKSEQGVFKLKQAMGGGKTHNLLVLGLLAQFPEFRQSVMGQFYKSDISLGKVRVVAFSGRESDAPLGMWGAIAEQMEKREHFKDLYSPLQAPGQKAWESLFNGETVLIMLDELPPYFVNAKSKAIGNSDLAQVTATALSNLLVALGKESCSRVCLVITDLTASYESGSEQIAAIIKDFEYETHRTALPVEPVRMNSDELYHILRRRIFEDLPSDDEITKVAHAYAQAVRDAKQMDITNESPELFVSRILVSYPFHPAIRDLYARFRENSGFQQTRGLIRLMRIVVSRLWNNDLAGKRYLIAAHDLDFNDRETRAEVGQINNTLENAIAHDIASDGSAVAEKIDVGLGGNDAQDVCRLLMIASLPNVPNSVLGLSVPELIAYLAEPGRNLLQLRNQLLENLATSAWYLHSDRDGKLFFKNVQNLNAKLESLVRAYLPEQAVKELRVQLEKLFSPTNGWCYQHVLALPAIDEIELDQERVTLVITKPHAGSGLRPELKSFFDQTTWKNRIAFLTGSKNTYDQLIETGKRLKAIQQILGELKVEKIPDNDPQKIQANDLFDRIQLNFYSAVRETFTKLWYPIEDENTPNLVSADFTMRFEGNRYGGEQQITELLTEKMKFTTEVSGEIFRKKCELRLFTTQSLPWNEIKRRSAIYTKWQWHIPKALDTLKVECIQKDFWRENGGYVDKGPFPQPKTSVIVHESFRDDNSGEVSLRVTPVHADIIYFDIGGQATTASARLDGATFRTNELIVSFLAVDSTGEHEVGDPITWQNRITLKHREFQSGTNKKIELQAFPLGKIYYTTDGSDPKVAGAVYDEPFVIPKGSLFVLAYAEQDGLSSQIDQISIQWEDHDKFKIDPKRPALYVKRQGFNSTKESYEFLDRVKKFQAQLSGVTIDISGESGDRGWIQLSMYPEKIVDPTLLEDALSGLRKLQTTGQVQISIGSIHFQSGQDLLYWAETVKVKIETGEVKQ